MSRTYTKREFLKMMGLGLAFLPFMGCFDHKEGNSSGDAGLQPQDKAGADLPEVTANDVLLLTRNDEAYASFNQAYNKRIQHFPKHIAVCKTEKGVQYALAKAREEKLKVAVKSGGHSFEGFSSNDGGMVINLSQMKQVEWIDSHTVSIQPGCLLQEVQAALFPKKRLLPAGSCGTVGIGGLTLGGGYGFFSRTYGLTCDSLLQLRMVAADGRIVSTEEEPELLWACKGGGNGNFGVVTSLRFRVYDMPPLFDSYVLKFRNLDAIKFGATLEAWFGVSEQLPPEAFAAYVLNGNTLTVLVTTYGKYPGLEEQLQPLIALADTVKPTPDAPLPAAMKRYYGRKGPIYFKNASAGLYKGKADIWAIKDALFETVTGNKGIVFQVNTLGGKIADAAFEKSSCYPHRSLPYLGELQAYWDQPADEQRLLKAFEAIQSLFRHAGVTAHYRNYPDINFKSWEQAYYGDNYSRLQEVKRRYDPEDIFHYPQSVRL